MPAFFPKSKNRASCRQINRSVLSTAKKNRVPLETRRSKRVDCNTSIVYEYYDPENFGRKDTFKMGTAKLCNYSRGGMCLELSRALKPDLPVYVKLDRTGTLPDLESAYGYHVEVIWCRRPASQKGKGFLIGVRFYESPLAKPKKKLCYSA